MTEQSPPAAPQLTQPRSFADKHPGRMVAIALVAAAVGIWVYYANQADTGSSSSAIASSLDTSRSVVSTPPED